MSVFVAVEGPNGVGKSTLIAVAAHLLERSGISVHTTREPSGTLLGTAIRELEPTLPAEALALACAADRADHITREIEPALERGQLVISDRYVPSSLVLQRLDGLELDYIWSINKNVRAPDLTLFLEDDPATIDSRLATRTGTRRFESPGVSARELELFREARQFLGERGWKSEVVDGRGLTPEEGGRALADAIDSFYDRGRPG